MMIRATKVLTAGSWNGKESDRIELPHDGRHHRRIVMRAVGDLVFLLDLAEATMLRDGDGLVLEDGRIVRVVATPEPIAEITGDAPLLARIAWHLGNRHVPVEIVSGCIRIGRDHELENMAAKLGASVGHIEAPFDPEGGVLAHEMAEAHGHHHHDHDHGHNHDDDHAHKHGRRHGR